MIKIIVEIELDNIITVKRLTIPYAINKDSVKRNQYIREYYINLGYVVGNHLRIC